MRVRDFDREDRQETKWIGTSTKDRIAAFGRSLRSSASDAHEGTRSHTTGNGAVYGDLR